MMVSMTKGLGPPEDLGAAELGGLLDVFARRGPLKVLDEDRELPELRLAVRGGSLARDEV